MDSIVAAEDAAAVGAGLRDHVVLGHAGPDRAGGAGPGGVVLTIRVPYDAVERRARRIGHASDVAAAVKLLAAHVIATKARRVLPRDEEDGMTFEGRDGVCAPARAERVHGAGSETDVPSRRAQIFNRAPAAVRDVAVV